MIAILIFAIFISFAYAVLICRLIFGWNSIPDFPSPENDLNIPVSVIIAFRNEENNLPALFKSLKEQTYPSEFTEIIFADDHSSDKSVEMVKNFILAGGNSSLISLKGSEIGKKTALAHASVNAKGKLLLFTDADCILENTWISTIVNAYQSFNPVLIAAPVIISPSSGFLSRFQSLEFFSLMASTAGSFGINDPIMVNGANLAVDKDAYLNNIGNLNNQTASGDDVFLLLNLKKNFPGRLFFLKSKDASVYVLPQTHIKTYIQQRMRWVSKSRFYRDKSIIISAIVVLLINLFLLNCFVMSFFNYYFLIIGGSIFIIKTILDYSFLRVVLDFFNKKGLLKFFVLSQFLYFLYISFIGIAGNIIPSSWKGRRVN